MIALHDASKTLKTVGIENIFITKLTSDSFPREQFNVCSSREFKCSSHTYVCSIYIDDFMKMFCHSRVTGLD